MSKNRHMKKKRMAIAAGLTAGLMGGGAAGFAFADGALGAGAQTATTTTVAPATSGLQGTANATRPDPTKRLGEILKPLVDKGTITQAQSDAVVKQLETAGPLGGRGGPGGGFGHGGGPGGAGGPDGRRGRPGLDAAAKALGTTTDELRTDLQSGKKITDIATEKKIDINTVIDAMVNDLKTHLADEVKNGRITQAQADERAATAKDRITKMVNGQLPPHPDGPPPADGSAPSSSAPTTTAPAGN